MCVKALTQEEIHQLILVLLFNSIIESINNNSELFEFLTPVFSNETLANVSSVVVCASECEYLLFSVNQLLLNL